VPPRQAPAPPIANKTKTFPASRFYRLQGLHLIEFDQTKSGLG
jgi:hypothetical protein